MADTKQQIQNVRALASQLRGQAASAATSVAAASSSEGYALQAAQAQAYAQRLRGNPVTIPQSLDEAVFSRTQNYFSNSAAQANTLRSKIQSASKDYASWSAADKTAYLRQLDTLTKHAAQASADLSGTKYTGLRKQIDEQLADYGTMRQAIQSGEQYYSQFSSDEEYQQAKKTAAAYEKYGNLSEEELALRSETIHQEAEALRRQLQNDDILRTGARYGGTSQGLLTDEQRAALEGKIKELQAMTDEIVPVYLDKQAYGKTQAQIDAAKEDQNYASMVREGKLLYEHPTGLTVDAKTGEAERAAEDRMKRGLGDPESVAETWNTPAQGGSWYEDISGVDISESRPLDYWETYVPYMTEDEKDLYYYKTAAEGQAAAFAFIRSLESTLRSRKAQEDAANTNGVFETGLLAARSGLDQFAQGIASLGMGQYSIDYSATQETAAQKREELGVWGGLGFDMVQTLANQAIPAVVGRAAELAAPGAGRIVNAVILGASAAGNAYKEALDQGYTKQQAANYGMLTGASEAGLEYLLNGVAGITGKLTKRLGEGAVDAIQSTFKRVGLKLAKEYGGEFTEEYLQEILSPVLRNLALEEDNEFALFSADALYAGLLGALAAGVTSTGSVIRGDAALRRTGQSVIDGNMDAGLVDYALLTDTQSAAHELAAQLDSGEIEATAYNVGRLYAAVQEEIGDSAAFMAVLQEAANQGVQADAQVVEEAVRSAGKTDVNDSVAQDAAGVYTGTAQEAVTPEAAVNTAAQRYASGETRAAFVSGYEVAQAASPELEVETYAQAFDTLYSAAQDGIEYAYLAATPAYTAMQTLGEQAATSAWLAGQHDRQQGIGYTERGAGNGQAIQDQRQGDYQVRPTGSVDQRGKSGIRSMDAGAADTGGISDERLPSSVPAQTGAARTDQHGQNLSVSYTQSNAADGTGVEVARRLSSKGIDVVVADGPLQTDKNGRTVIYENAFTAPDGTVYVSNDAALPVDDIAAHEPVHVLEMRGDTEYDSWYDVLVNNSDPLSGAYQETVQKIIEGYGLTDREGNTLDPLDTDSVKPIFRELTAYIHQYLTTDPAYAEAIFSGMFTDWGAVVEAYHRLHDYIESLGTTTEADPKTGPASFDNLFHDEPLHYAEETAYEIAARERYGIEAPLTDAQQQVRDIGEQLGVQVKFDWEGTGDGYYKGGVIHLKPNAKRPLASLFKHELTHHAEQAGWYYDFQSAVFDSAVFSQWIKSQKANVAEHRNALAERYEKQGVTLDEDSANREIVADFVGDVLFRGGDIEGLAELAQRNRTVWQRFCDWLRGIAQRLTKAGRDAADVQRLERRYRKLLNSAMDTAVENGAGQFSIQTDENGDSVVVINTDQHVFDGVPRSEWPKVARRYIRERFAGKTLAVGEHDAVYVDNKASGEYAYPSKPLGVQSNEYAGKMKAATELDNLLLASEYSHSSRDTKAHKEASVGWDYYKTCFIVDGHAFEGLINIANSETGRKFYDITKVKELPATIGQRVALVARSAPNSGNSIDPSVPQSSTGVNTQSMQAGGEYTRGQHSISARAENPAQIAAQSYESANGELPRLRPLRGAWEGNAESSLYGSLQATSLFDDVFKEKALTDAFIQKYTTVSDRETLEAAKAALDVGGWDYVIRWKDAKPDTMSAQDVAAGFILMSRYQAMGKYDDALAVAEKLRNIGTEAGRTVQMFSVLGTLDPNAMLYYAQKSLKDAYEAMVKGKTERWIDENRARFSLTNEEAEFIRLRTVQAAKLPQGRDRNIRIAEICSLLQRKIPPQKGQSVRALQRISMLFNPKTNIRNILGNAIIMPVSIASDAIGAGIDRVLSKMTGVRTTGTFKAQSLRGMKKGFFESYDDFRRKINTRGVQENRFDIGTGLSFNERHTGFAAEPRNRLNKVLNVLDRVTSFLLDAGDRPFYETWFINSLNNQIRLNNASEPTAEMIEIATQEALERTWQDDNAYTRSVSGIKRFMNNINIAGYGAGDIFIKFTKTPANLTKAIVELSPAGLVKALAVDARRFYNAVQTGQATPQAQRAFVNSLSKGIVGTTLTLLFYALARAGILHGKVDDDKDVAAFERNILGWQPYSVSIGDFSFSYDWMQPVGALAAIAADIAEDDEARPLYEEIYSAIQAGGTVLFNQSFMQSLQNFFSNDNPAQALIDGILDEPAAFVPQIFSQLARVFDDKVRTTYEYGDVIMSSVNRVRAKVPGLRNSLEPTVDVFGREVEQLSDPFNAFLNPANTQKANMQVGAEEIYRLYQETGEKGVFPSATPYSIQADGQKHVLEPEERTRYQKTYGEVVSESVEEFTTSHLYGTLSPGQSVEVLDELYKYAKEKAKQEVIEGYTPDKKYAETLPKAEEKGIPAWMYLASLKLYEDSDGSGGFSKAEKVAAIKKLDISDQDKRILISLL